MSAERPSQYTPAELAAFRLRDDLEIARAVGHVRPLLSDMPWQLGSVIDTKALLIAGYRRTVGNSEDAAIFITTARRDGDGDAYHLTDKQPSMFSGPEWTDFVGGAKNNEFYLGGRLPSPEEETQSRAAIAEARANLHIAPTELRLVLAVDTFRSLGVLTVLPRSSGKQQAAA